MTEIRARKGLQFIFSLAKRVSEMLTQLPHEQATMNKAEVYKSAQDRERFVLFLFCFCFVFVLFLFLFCFCFVFVLFLFCFVFVLFCFVLRNDVAILVFYSKHHEILSNQTKPNQPTDVFP